MIDVLLSSPKFSHTSTIVDIKYMFFCFQMYLLSNILISGMMLSFRGMGDLYIYIYILHIKTKVDAGQSLVPERHDEPTSEVFTDAYLEDHPV